MRVAAKSLARRSVLVTLSLLAFGSRAPQAHAQAKVGARTAAAAAQWFTVGILDTLRGEQLLARPTDIARLPDGRYLVVDQSEKNLKLYDTEGRLATVLGRAGGGPGEFLSLASGGWVGGRPFGFDRATNSVKWYSADLKYDAATAINAEDRPQLYRVLALPGERFLECSFAAGREGQRLVALRGRDGNVSAAMFPLSPSIARPAVAQYTVTLCDSRDGVIFAALSGGDSLHAFSEQGVLIASEPLLLDGRPIKSFASLVDANGGSARLKDGGWVQHGMQMAIRITAMRGGLVAVQVIEFDAVKGVDVVEGGRVSVLQLRDGRLTSVGTIPLKAGLFNATERGAFLLRWLGRGAERVEVAELVIRGAP